MICYAIYAFIYYYFAADTLLCAMARRAYYYMPYMLTLRRRFDFSRTGCCHAAQFTLDSAYAMPMPPLMPYCRHMPLLFADYFAAFRFAATPIRPLRSYAITADAMLLIAGAMICLLSAIDAFS